MGETWWRQSAQALRWERWARQLSCSFRIHAHLPRQTPHQSQPAEPCTPACGHPLSSAPSGTRQSSTTPALTRKGGGGAGVHDSVSCAMAMQEARAFLRREFLNMASVPGDVVLEQHGGGCGEMRASQRRRTTTLGTYGARWRSMNRWRHTRAHLPFSTPSLSPRATIDEHTS